MIGVEIFLIIIGVVFMLGSFLVQDKLSGKDIDQITRLSADELKIIIDKQLKNADSEVENAIEEKMDEALEISERGMEKTCNEKIMAISDFSDTVLDAMNKTHNEIMFLYSMLNDKHKEMTEFAGELSRFSEQMRATEDAALKKLAEAAEKIEEDIAVTNAVDEQELLVEAVKRQEKEEDKNHNEDILFLHSMGKSDVEIAKQLGLGLGEVKLVIGLFKEDTNSEI